MPAQSQQQQKLFGLALAFKRGEVPASEVSDEIKDIADRMSEKEIEDFAATKHKGLPKMKEQLRKIVREIMREKVISEITEGKKRKHINENIPRMFKVYLGVQNKLRKLEDEQKKMLGQFKDEKDPKKKRNILDKMKAGTVRLKKVRANLADIEREYINKASYDTSYSESVNEGIEPQIKKIAYYTGTRPEAVEDFVSKHALNFTKLLKYVEKGGLPQRMELVSALAGRPNNPTQKKVIKMFNESINEGYSTEEKRIVMMAVRKLSKYRNVPIDQSINDLLGAGAELQRDIKKGKIKK